MPRSILEEDVVAARDWRVCLALDALIGFRGWRPLTRRRGCPGVIGQKGEAVTGGTVSMHEGKIIGAAPGGCESTLGTSSRGLSCFVLELCRLCAAGMKHMAEDGSAAVVHLMTV